MAKAEEFGFGLETIHLHYLDILISKGTMLVFRNTILCLASRVFFLLRAPDASEESLDKRVAELTV